MYVTFSQLGSMGRLGNQMFQIASTIGISKKNGSNPVFPKWLYSRHFSNPIKESNIGGINFSKYHERSFNFSEVRITSNTDLIGYFQSEKYFYECRTEIKNTFEFLPELTDTRLSDFCSIHIRRTDYLKFSDYHPFPGMDYYKASIERVKKRDIQKFLIFSDDIEWCKENFKGEEFSFSEGLDEIHDMARMSSCGHNIIANSSFSWWGAWLNKNPQKIVISPSRWFGPAKRNVITKDLYCEDWIII